MTDTFSSTTFSFSFRYFTSAFINFWHHV